MKSGRARKKIRNHLREIPAVFFPPWWAVSVLAEITATFGGTRNRRRRYRRKTKYRLPPKKYRHIAVPPKRYRQKTEYREPQKHPAIQYHQKSTAIMGSTGNRQ
ncbi:unnamed protein product, partial [Ectocarpus sp. 6 AP-2014]